MKKFGIMAAASAMLPVSAFAADIRNLDSIFLFIKNILNTVLPLIIAAAVVYFVWGMFQLFLAGDEEKHEKAKTTVIYGVIAIFVMVSVWGLVNILANTFNLNNSSVQGDTQPLQKLGL
ncbi:MAG TPA: pilin [Candidatus Paceibacterota bacterium]|nr:pilin [Candidatus Paceibacterota bacterium]